jgi:hypothetical protein
MHMATFREKAPEKNHRLYEKNLASFMEILGHIDHHQETRPSDACISHAFKHVL